MDASLWGSIGSGRKSQKERQRYFESFSQRQNLINSSDEDSEDEEWIRQLERDYGRRSIHSNKKTKWTRLEKLLTFSLFCSFAFIVFLISALLYSRYKHGETLLQFTLGGQRYCNKEGCVSASNRVQTFLDKNTNPCDSFYDHACGSWIKNSELPSTHTKLTSFTAASDHNQRTLKRLLDKMLSTKQTSRTLEKVRVFYKSCLRKQFIENHGNQSLHELITYVGSWAMTNSSDWNEEEWSFGQALTRIHHLKSMPLFYMYVAADDKNSTQNIIQIEQSGITLSDGSIYNMPSEDKVIQSYKKLMMTVGSLLGGTKESVQKQANEVFEFEKSLAQIYEKENKYKDSDQVYNKISIAELQKLCPAIPWLDYMNSMFSEPVRSNEEVIVYTPEYLRKMSDLVIKTERRIIANYMVWHLIKPILHFLSKPYRTAALELANKETGLNGVDDSWKNCVTKTDSVLGYGTGHLFVREAESQGNYDEKKVKRMLQLVKEEFILNLRHLKWMDDVTTKKAIDKANMIIDLVGFPSWIKRENSLDSYYDNLNITEDPLRNYFNAREFYHSKTMERRGKPVSKNEWHMTPTEVNAYYNAPNNYIALPIGLLQSPFFSTEFPMSINFGALGTIMAHELTHAFDSQGKNFDKNGNLKRWWSDMTSESFNNETNCMIKHYQTFDGKDDTGKNLAENLADNGGLKVAYNAFKTGEYVDGQDMTLPGLSLTSDQLFFMGYAQSWCSLSTPEKSQQEQKIDSHISERIRVDATLANSNEFSKAFKCPIGSRMNPKNKCRVW